MPSNAQLSIAAADLPQACSRITAAPLDTPRPLCR